MLDLVSMHDTLNIPTRSTPRIDQPARIPSQLTRSHILDQTGKDQHYRFGFLNFLLPLIILDNRLLLTTHGC